MPRTHVYVYIVLYALVMAAFGWLAYVMWAKKATGPMAASLAAMAYLGLRVGMMAMKLRRREE